MLWLVDLDLYNNLVHDSACPEVSKYLPVNISYRYFSFGEDNFWIST